MRDRQTMRPAILSEQQLRRTWTVLHYFRFGKRFSICICTTTSRIVQRGWCFQPFLFKNCTTTSRIVQRVLCTQPFHYKMYCHQYNCTEVVFSELWCFSNETLNYQQTVMFFKCNLKLKYVILCLKPNMKLRGKIDMDACQSPWRCGANSCIILTTIKCVFWYGFIPFAIFVHIILTFDFKSQFGPAPYCPLLRRVS